ncbi:MAG: hypothetical protein AB7G08_25750 [Hyphomicrobiaceae bacterium]
MMPYALNNLLDDCARGLSLSREVVIEQWAVLAEDHADVRPTAKAIRGYVSKAPERITAYHATRLQELLEAQSEPSAVPAQRAYRRALGRCAQTIGVGGPDKAARRRIQINYGSSLASESHGIGDQLAGYEGVYALTRLQTDNLRFYQDILVLKRTDRTKLLVTLLAQPVICRGFGYLVQGALYCPTMGTERETRRRRIASLMIARDANDRTDIMCGILMGLSTADIHPVSIPIFLNRVPSPSADLMSIEIKTERQIRERMAGYNSEICNVPAELKQFYGLPKRTARSIGYTILDPAAINNPFRDTRSVAIQVSSSLKRLCSNW